MARLIQNMSMKLQQKLAPQLIQSLRLLQMPTLELRNLIKQELEINPLLEQVEQEPSEEEGKEETPEEDRADEERELDSDFDEVDWSNYLDESFDISGYNHPEFDPNQESEREPRENRITGQVSMTDMLNSQLKLEFSSEEDIRIGEFIIGSLDEDGFLTSSPEEMAESLNVPVCKVERVLKVIQGFEPPGIAARNLRESLMIQLEEQGQEDTTAMRIVRDHLEDLTKHRYGRICKSLGISQEKIQEALELISRLNPRPGSSLPEVSSNAEEVERALKIVIPDLTVEEVEGEYVVRLNNGLVPTLRVSPYYRSLLSKSGDADEETRQYVVDRLNKARWLINAINQRRSTILKVVNYIVEAQQDFFEHGVGHLKPMVLREVADAVGMHPSTISRVTSGKYVETPHGVFELKYFFDGKVSSSHSDDVSARSVKDRIGQLIESEDPKEPLSDQRIADILEEEGIDIARRTVAKYRDQMKINSAKYRQRL